ncbi:zinc knuckle CX2CX4HX4C [Artemisia annua]|uniref:Zinc knuckle CX2CX4HX4C n=1 Tax=Artemisia annua TaxID=35608 RepID=A0A2U1P4S8_ARTAN|nr:zinc knuckle CX2CX4HX4C [Artemisia annua]
MRGLTGSDGGSSLGVKNHGKSHVVSKDDSDVNANNKSKIPVNGSNEVYARANVSLGSNVIRDIPVAFVDNLVLNPDKGKSNVLGKADSDKNMNVGGVNNQWPSLSETVKHVGSKGDGGLQNKNCDTVMTENFVSKDVSFASAFKWLTGLASRIGNPIIMDRITTSMCEKAYGRASFARVLIEVDASTDLVENIEVCYEKLGKSMNLKVEYAWRPPLCTLCKVFGHELKNCRSRVVTVDEEKEKEVAKNAGANNVSTVKIDGSNNNGEEWQEASKVNRNGATTSRSYGQQDSGYFLNRGGFNGRGRGGMQGRGGFTQRGGNENYNVKYVPAENSGRKIDDGLVMEGKAKNNLMNKEKGISGVNENNGQTKTKNVTSVKNSFDVLAKEGVDSVDSVDVGSDEWVQMRSKFDLACELVLKLRIS